MNAVRWNPQGQAVAPTKFDMIGKISGETSSTLVVTISASTTTGTGSLLPVPTYDFSCSGLTVGSNGSATPSLEFEGFLKNSPIRPLCAKRTVVANEFTAFGDLKLKVPAKLDVVVSGWIAFDVAFKLPTGFKRIMFTGLTTDSGIPGSALLISYNSKTSYAMDLLSPPLQVDTSSLISSASQVAVLFYNDTSTELNYVSITSWTEFWTVSMTIPGPGVYIFGRLDSTNTGLPAALGTSVSFWGDWKSKVFMYPNDVKITLTSDKNGAVKVSKPAFILSSINMDFAAVYEISTTLPASSIKLEIGLIYKNLDWV